MYIYIYYIIYIYIYCYIHKIDKSSNSIVHGFQFASCSMTRPQAGANCFALWTAQVLQHATHKTASNVVQRMLEHADVSRHLDLAQKLPRNHVYSTVYTRSSSNLSKCSFFFSKMSTLDQQTDDGLKRSSTSDCAPNGTIHGGFTVTLGDFTESTLVFQSVVWICCN